jgi:hypothetical protein
MDMSKELCHKKMKLAQSAASFVLKVLQRRHKKKSIETSWAEQSHTRDFL